MSEESRPEPAILEQIGQILDRSKRPAFVIGAAMDRGNAWNEVVRLAERHNASVFTAPHSGRCGFPENHPLFAGLLPAWREKIVAQLKRFDCILAIGAPAYLFQTLSEVRDPSDIIVEEAPSTRPTMQAYLPVTQSNGFFTIDSGGLGYGMPAAVGVALAANGKRVINVMGDGSSMYSIKQFGPLFSTNCQSRLSF